MKPLTIEELKALEVGDWVWVIDLMYNKGIYCRKGKIKKSNTSVDGMVYSSMERAFYHVGYGTNWIAYKNKEKAEIRTNREWLFSLTDEELARFLFSPVYQGIYRSYASSELGIRDWLNGDCSYVEAHYNKETGTYK